MAKSRDRSELLDGIEAIVLRRGFAHLTVSELAARLRCSRSTLYQLAPSKDDLVVMVVARYANRAQAAALDAALAPDLTAPERISTYAHVIHTWQGKCSVQLWKDIETLPAAKAMFRERNVEGSATVSGFMEEGMRRGEIRPVNPKYLAAVIRAAADLSRNPQVLRDSGLTAGEAMEELGRFVVAGLRK